MAVFSLMPYRNTVIVVVASPGPPARCQASGRSQPRICGPDPQRSAFGRKVSGNLSRKISILGPKVYTGIMAEADSGLVTAFWAGVLGTARYPCPNDGDVMQEGPLSMGLRAVEAPNFS